MASLVLGCLDVDKIIQFQVLNCCFRVMAVLEFMNKLGTGNKLYR